MIVFLFLSCAIPYLVAFSYVFEFGEADKVLLYKANYLIDENQG